MRGADTYNGRKNHIGPNQGQDTGRGFHLVDVDNSKVIWRENIAKDERGTGTRKC